MVPLYDFARVTVPALYVAGDRDLVVRFPCADKFIANLGQLVPQLRETINAPGLWTLDPARATRRDQCGAGPVSERTQLTRPLFLLAMRRRTTNAKVTDLQMRKVAKWLN